MLLSRRWMQAAVAALLLPAFAAPVPAAADSVQQVFTISSETAEEWSGKATVRIDGAAAATIDVAAGPAKDSVQQAQEGGRQGRYPQGHFAENLYAYEPMYFLYGRDPENGRFQLSLKFRFLDTAEPDAHEWSPLQGFFFGYTQTSLWDLAASSKPFEDTSYMPELFYLRQDISFRPGGRVSRVDFQAGVQHESNGQAGEASRSLNIAYIRPTLFFGNPGGYHLEVSPKIWIYVGDLSENPDIYRYRGYFDLHIDYGSDDGWKFATMWRKGTEGSKGSVQLDVTYPLGRLFFDNLDFFLHGQLFSGYGESLLHYDQSDTRFRLGVAVYR